MVDHEAPRQPTIGERILSGTRLIELPRPLADRIYQTHMEAFSKTFPDIDFSAVKRTQLKSVALTYHHGPEAVSAWKEARRENKIDLWNETLTEIITLYTQRVDEMRAGKLTPAQMTDQLMKAAWLYGSVKSSDIRRIPEGAYDIDKWLFQILLGNGNDMSVEDVERVMSLIARAYFTGDYDELKTTYEEVRERKGLHSQGSHIDSLMTQRLEVSDKLNKLRNSGMCIPTADGYHIHISVQKTIEKIMAKSATPILDLIFRLMYQDERMGMPEGQWGVLQAAMELKRVPRHEFIHFIAEAIRAQNASST